MHKILLNLAKQLLTHDAKFPDLLSTNIMRKWTNIMLYIPVKLWVSWNSQPLDNLKYTLTTSQLVQTANTSKHLVYTMFLLFVPTVIQVASSCSEDS